MNTVANTERPKLKLNFGAKPLTLNTNGGALVAASTLRQVVVFEKSKRDIKDTTNSPATSDNKDETTAATKSSSKKKKNSKKQEAAAGNKQIESSKKAVNQKVVASPEKVLKEKIKRRKKEYFNILTRLKADFPEVFSEEVKPLAIGIDLELKKILNGEIPNIQLGRFFHRYCGSFKYKEKLIEGAQRFHLDGSPATLVTQKEVPVMVSKPRFNKKSRNSSDTASTDSNEIEQTQ